ncbi:MAG: ECF-type sigma factor, partial [Acidobacteriota bacterium]
DDALNALAVLDPRKSQIIELRFFGGLSIAETAEAMKISSITVTREWRSAKAWLRREMNNTSDKVELAREDLSVSCCFIAEILAVGNRDRDDPPA